MTLSELLNVTKLLKKTLTESLTLSDDVYANVVTLLPYVVAITLSKIYQLQADLEKMFDVNIGG